MVHTVVVDLVGVLIHINPRKIFFRLGLRNLISCVALYRKNPIQEVFRFLDFMRTHCPGEYQHLITFQGHYLPKSFCDFQRGKISSQECLQRIENFFDYIRPQGYFVSAHQERCMKHFMNIIFTPRILGEFFELDTKVYRFLCNLKSHGSYRCYLFSNIDKEAFAVIQARFSGVMQLFDGIITSYETGYLKPEQAIYDILYKKYHIDPANTLYIDDQKDNLEPAHTQGVHVVHYKKRSDLEKAKKQYF